MNVYVSHTQRTRWQRSVIRELTTILHTYADLPVIAWTISPAGSVLIGQIDQYTARDADVAEVFHAWRQALMLTTGERVNIGGVTHLAADAARGRIRVKLRGVIADADGVE